MVDSILKINGKIANEDKIVNLHYHTYTPYTISYNNNDEIRIAIQSQDLYVLPSESYLHIEFDVRRRADVAVEIGENSVWTNNFVSHLFSEVRYELNGFEIDRCKTPGITSLMKCMTACKLEDKDMYSLYQLNSGTGIRGATYRMILPLRFIFGFCDDYNKIILNAKHELILVRSRSDANLYTSTRDVETAQITVNKIHWKIQHVTLSDASKLLMLKTLERNDDIALAYRSWDLYELPALPQTSRHNWSVKTTTQLTKPRYVIVGFQTNRNFRANGDISQFDHCNISDVKLHLNNERYPYDNMNLTFGDGYYHELYHTYLKMQQSYYNNTSAYNPALSSYDNFFNKPIFVFDCSRSDETIKSGMVDVRIEINARANIPENTTAYCLIIHDNMVWYSPFSSIVQRSI